MIEGISMDSWFGHLYIWGLHFAHLSIPPALSWAAVVGSEKGMEVVGSEKRMEVVGCSQVEVVETVLAVHRLLEQR
jgi:hypothetical protein